jgi:hypothetical protein
MGGAWVWSPVARLFLDMWLLSGDPFQEEQSEEVMTEAANLFGGFFEKRHRE